MVVMVAQMVKFNYLPYTTYIGVTIRIFLAYFTVRVLGKNFTKYYVDIIYVLSIMGFFIYVPQLIVPGFGRFLISSISPLLRNPLYSGDIWYAPDIIFYVFNSGVGMYRNCGPFWEPGAYSGFLVIAMIFHYLESKTITDKKSIVLILALLSTFSTTGLIRRRRRRRFCRESGISISSSLAPYMLARYLSSQRLRKLLGGAAECMGFAT